jgi:D-alanine-D-alanine ligase
MTKKLRVAILTGGASSEREISLATGFQIAASLPQDRYETVLLDPLALMSRNPALTEAQRTHARALLEGGGRTLPAALPKGLEQQIESATRALVPATTAFSASAEPVDVVLIALHGTWGEDGRIQGLLDTLGIPYTGSGVLASALAMDKVMAKTVLAANGLDVPRGVVVSGTDATELARAAQLPLPLFVKPVGGGSSVGAAIVSRREELAPAVTEALRQDRRVLVEEYLRGRELTVAVIGNDDLQALPVIEIVTSHAFFDYAAKYDAGESEEIVPAHVPDDVAARAQELALRAHHALGCRGMSRTDFVWLTDQPDRMVALEVNTIPGMTANSLLPRAAKAAGISFSDLVQKLVGWALEDAARQAR